MNKATKGALAIGAAVALLLGGASSIAYWQSSAATDAANFTMGKLALEANEDGMWTLDDVEIAPGEIRLIPGQTLQYTQTFEIEASGDGLLITAEIVDEEATSPDDWSYGFSHTVWINGDDDVVEHIVDGVYEVKKSGTVTVNASLYIAEYEEGGKGASISVHNGRVLLQQVATLPTEPPCAC